LVGLLSDQGVPPEDWRGLLDALTTTPDPFRLGLVDVNTAPAAVLASLPGLDADAAEAIVDARERLDIADRLSPVWLLDEGVVTDERFRECVDWLAVRCLQWRFTVRASFEEEDASFVGFDPGDALPELLPEADEFGVAIGDGDDGPAGPTLEFEVVMDLADPTPRIAYLRERTAYDLAVAVASLPGFVGDGPESETEGGEEVPLGDGGWPAESWPDESWADETWAEAPWDGGEGAGGAENAIGNDGAGSLRFGDPRGGASSGDGRGSRGPDAGGERGVSSPAGPSSGRRGGSGGDRSSGSGPASSGDNRLGRWAPARDRASSRGGRDR
jgi:hypothetical protein